MQLLESKLMLVKFDPSLSFFTHKGVILTMLDKPYKQYFCIFIFGMHKMQNKSYLQEQHTTSFFSEVREIKHI